MKDTFWVGVYPGMTDEMIDFMAKTIKEAVNQQEYVRQIHNEESI